MSMDDNDGQMMFGDLVGLKLPDICLTGEEKPRKKTSPRKPVPTGDRTRARWVTGEHAAAWPKAVDTLYGLIGVRGNKNVGNPCSEVGSRRVWQGTFIRNKNICDIGKSLRKSNYVSSFKN